MSEPGRLDPEDVLGPPPTGEAAIDDALLGLAELGSLPLDEHHDRLARAHEALQSALDAPVGELGSRPVSGPGAAPPRPGPSHAT
jgi:hypothetical protein